jgi:xanthine dehydrogenase accessory factor
MNLFKSIVDFLESGENFVLANVLTRTGSAPRSTGARMIVHPDGRITGTVGGGILEARVQETAAEIFSTKTATVSEFVLTADDAGRLGMICGGRVEVLLQFMDAAVPARLHFYKEVLHAVTENKRSWLITSIPHGDGMQDLPQWLLKSDGTVFGVFDSDFPGKERVIRELAGKKHGYLHFEANEYHIEALCNSGTAFLFGAGHVGYALSRVTPLVDFRTIVLDDREDFANPDRLDSADEVIVLPSFDRATEGLPIDEDSYIVIVTRGHLHDQTVLEQALRTDAGYIGMIGSRRKRDAVYKSLEAKHGFGPHDFARVHSPVGLSIGAETPEEIAVSIVAEMIQVRAGKNR